MGYALVDRVFDLPDLSPSERLVLMAMARRANDSTSASTFMSVETIAGLTGLGESTVKATRARLVDRGLICPVGWTGRGGRATREYRLDLERGLDTRPQGARFQTPGGQISDPRGPIARPQGANSETQFHHGSDHGFGSHAGARDLPPEQWGKGWGEPAEEEQAEPENLVPQEPIGPSQHAFYSSGQPSAETRPSTSASATRESASPVVSDVERAVAYYAEVAPLTLRRALRGFGPARGRVEAAVAQHGADAVIAAIDAASTARADGCPPWDWVLERLNGKTRPAGGRRNGYDPEKDPRVVGWSRSMK